MASYTLPQLVLHDTERTALLELLRQECLDAYAERDNVRGDLLATLRVKIKTTLVKEG